MRQRPSRGGSARSVLNYFPTGPMACRAESHCSAPLGRDSLRGRGLGHRDMRTFGFSSASIAHRSLPTRTRPLTSGRSTSLDADSRTPSPKRREGFELRRPAEHHDALHDDRVGREATGPQTLSRRDTGLKIRSSFARLGFAPVWPMPWAHDLYQHVARPAVRRLRGGEGQVGLLARGVIEQPVVKDFDFRENLTDRRYHAEAMKAYMPSARRSPRKTPARKSPPKSRSAA